MTEIFGQIENANLPFPKTKIMPYSTPIPATEPLANAIGQQRLVDENKHAPQINEGDKFSMENFKSALAEEKMKEYLVKVGLATQEELNKAKIRRHAVETEHTLSRFSVDGAPLWFNHHINVFMDQLCDRLDKRMGKYERENAISWNSKAGDGISKPYKIVKFQNGQDPTAPPHNLPPIRSLQQLQQLPSAAINAYLVGYGFEGTLPRTVSRRRRILGPYIGYLGTL